MTQSAAELSGGGEWRSRIVGDRVACWRIGLVDLDRCRECPYLLRLEVAGTPPSGHVVCMDPHREAEIDFAW